MDVKISKGTHVSRSREQFEEAERAVDYRERNGFRCAFKLILAFLDAGPLFLRGFATGLPLTTFVILCV